MLIFKPVDNDFRTKGDIVPTDINFAKFSLSTLSSSCLRSSSFRNFERLATRFFSRVSSRYKARSQREIRQRRFATKNDKYKTGGLRER